VNQPRGTQRYRLAQREDEDRLTWAIIELASQYGRYGYRRITALLKRDGSQVGKDRGRADLASRRAEGTAAAETMRTAVVQRWIVRAAAAVAAEPCLELRLRQRKNARRKNSKDAEPDR
jgi:HTH-like domain